MSDNFFVSNSYVYGWTVNFAKGSWTSLSVPATPENSMHFIEFVQAMRSRYVFIFFFLFTSHHWSDLDSLHFFSFKGMWDSGHHPAIECVGHTDDDRCILSDE